MPYPEKRNIETLKVSGGNIMTEEFFSIPLASTSTQKFNEKEIFFIFQIRKCSFHFRTIKKLCLWETEAIKTIEILPRILLQDSMHNYKFVNEQTDCKDSLKCLILFRNFQILASNHYLLLSIQFFMKILKKFFCS